MERDPFRKTDETETPEQEVQKKKEKRLLTRREFYTGCIILLLCLVWTGRNIQTRIDRMENNILNQVSETTSEVRNISANVYSAMEQKNDPLTEREAFLAGADREKGTLRLSAGVLPKNYREGMQVTFLLTVNEGDTLKFAGKETADRHFVLNEEIPFSDSLVLYAAVPTADGENMTELYRAEGISVGLLPQVSFQPSMTITPEKDREGAEVVLREAELSVDPPRLLGGEGFLPPRELRLTVFINGKKKAENTLEKVFDDPSVGVYNMTEELKFTMKKGDSLEYRLNGTNKDGTPFKQTFEKGTYEGEGEIVMEAPAASVF